ncbi:MAG: glycosyltransferase [Alphaproteobacteria bacterium]|nr:glycosyltransferase [Alphaproteobacteria bacterium]
MVIVNLFNLKNTNGMYYYALDYIRRNEAAIEKILVRPNLAEDARRQFPELTVVECGLASFVASILVARARGGFLYTPTPHPVPFISRQLIVVHDAYPFFGMLGGLKKFLLRVSLETSKCLVGYINQSDASDFVRSIGVREARLVFAPNYFPPTLNLLHKSRDASLSRLRVGLFGTDSPKKNYEALFEEVIASGRADFMEFWIYGHMTAYFSGLRSRFGTIHCELVESDRFALAEFLGSVDVVVSVALNEGFGRPIAAALVSGVPCFLIETRVFREFFGGAAEFEASVSDIVTQLAAHKMGSEIRQIRLEVPTAVAEAQNRIERLLHEAGRG